MSVSAIASVLAREIIDSRGKPTVSVKLILEADRPGIEFGLNSALVADPCADRPLQAGGYWIGSRQLISGDVFH